MRKTKSATEILDKLSVPEPNSGCFLWIGCADKNGYGRASFRGNQMLAHRLAWVQRFGEIRDGMCVLHRCDTPSCCNVRHLFLGTASDNNKDAASKGRTPRGEKHWNMKVSDEDVIKIRADQRSSRKIATAYGICQRQASNIKNGSKRCVLGAA